MEPRRIANVQVAPGKSGRLGGADRTEEDLVGHSERTMSRDPAAAWVFLVDRLNTHQCESLVRFIAKPCRIEENVGVKGKAGMLESMSTRAAFFVIRRLASAWCIPPSIRPG